KRRSYDGGTARRIRDKVCRIAEVKSLLPSRGRDLENDTLPRSAVESRAVEITSRVQYDAACRIASIAATGKTVKRGARPAAAGRSQLEDRTVPIGAVLVGRAVEITGCVHN